MVLRIFYMAITAMFESLVTHLQEEPTISFIFTQNIQGKKLHRAESFWNSTSNTFGTQLRMSFNISLWDNVSCFFQSLLQNVSSLTQGIRWIKLCWRVRFSSGELTLLEKLICICCCVPYLQISHCAFVWSRLSQSHTKTAIWLSLDSLREAVTFVRITVLRKRLNFMVKFDCKWTHQNLPWHLISAVCVPIFFMEHPGTTIAKDRHIEFCHLRRRITFKPIPGSHIALLPAVPLDNSKNELLRIVWTEHLRSSFSEDYIRAIEFDRIYCNLRWNCSHCSRRERWQVYGIYERF